VSNGLARTVGTSVGTAARVTATAPTTPPTDFAFIYASTMCGEREEINTFDNTYTNFVPTGAYNAGTRTVALQLPADELNEIYRQMIGIDLFGYPDTLDTNRSGGGSSSYKFYRVRANGRIKEIRWTDDDPRVDKTTPCPLTIIALAGLGNTITRISRRHSEVVQIKRGVGCT
jgi:hypothetical protein